SSQRFAVSILTAFLLLWRSDVWYPLLRGSFHVDGVVGLKMQLPGWVVLPSDHCCFFLCFVCFMEHRWVLPFDIVW
ncbi:hypothetical protein Dimus_020422, partial [Dionaea muscipula]